jgi:hypothetical protein
VKFWDSGILGFWDSGILGFWDSGILGFWDWAIGRLGDVAGEEDQRCVGHWGIEWIEWIDEADARINE